MRVQNAICADLIFQWQRLSFEFDPVFSRDLWPYVQRRSLLLIGMPELEDDLGIAHGKTVHVADAPPQDEGVVIKTRIRSVDKNNLPDFRPAAGLRIVCEPSFQILGRALHQLAEVTKALNRGEAVGLQDELGLKVLKSIERMTVRVSGGPCLSLVPVGRMFVGVGRHRDPSPSLMVAMFILF